MPEVTTADAPLGFGSETKPAEAPATVGTVTPSPAPNVPASPPVAGEATPAPVPNPVPSILTDVEYGQLSDEVGTKGDLAPETYQKLAQKGLPEDVVRRFVNGQKADAELLRRDILQEFGGEAQFGQVQAWGAANLNPAEKAEFNKALASNNRTTIMQAVQAVKTRYTAEYGVQGTLLGGRKAPSGPTPYRSDAEFQRDIKDPRYNADPAFRADSVAKYQAALMAGILK